MITPKDILRLAILVYIEEELFIVVHDNDHESQGEEDQETCELIDEMIDSMTTTLKYRFGIKD